MPLASGCGAFCEDSTSSGNGSTMERSEIEGGSLNASIDERYMLSSFGSTVGVNEPSFSSSFSLVETLQAKRSQHKKVNKSKKVPFQ